MVDEAPSWASGGRIQLVRGSCAINRFVHLEIWSFVNSLILFLNRSVECKTRRVKTREADEPQIVRLQKLRRSPITRREVNLLEVGK
jgi:hypothetical protein